MNIVFQSNTTKMVVVTFVTGNVGKFKECKEILESALNGLDFELVQSEFDLPELQAEPEQCAKNKCEHAFRLLNDQSQSVLIEDVSLYFSAWKTLPGPYVK